MRTQDAITEFIRSRVLISPETLKWYRNRLGRFATTYVELPTSPEPLRDFLNTLSHLSDETARGYWRALRALYREICAQHQMPNPMLAVKRPRCQKKVMRTFSPESLFQLLTQPLNVRDKALLSLFLDTGIRAGEAVNLTWSDISGELIKVRGKTGQRLVPISAEIASQLNFLRAVSKDQHFVFTGKRGHLTYWGVYDIVHKACLRAGFQGKRLAPHTFRHTNGSLLVTAGCDLDTVQKLLGHSSIKETEKYVHQDIATIIRKHHSFSPMKLMHQAAQISLFDPEVSKEAEAIFKDSRGGE